MNSTMHCKRNGRATRACSSRYAKQIHQKAASSTEQKNVPQKQSGYSGISEKQQTTRRYRKYNTVRPKVRQVERPRANEIPALIINTAVKIKGTLPDRCEQRYEH